MIIIARALRQRRPPPRPIRSGSEVQIRIKKQDLEDFLILARTSFPKIHACRDKIS